MVQAREVFCFLGRTLCCCVTPMSCEQDTMKVYDELFLYCIYYSFISFLILSSRQLPLQQMANIFMLMHLAHSVANLSKKKEDRCCVYLTILILTLQLIQTLDLSSRQLNELGRLSIIPIDNSLKYRIPLVISWR